MVATRAMAAKKAPDVNDDKENGSQLALRKKPVRRATAKATTTSTKASTATKSTEQPATTISTRTTSAPPTRAAVARPKRQTRAAAAPTSEPILEPVPKKTSTTRRKPALPEVARGKNLRSQKCELEPEVEAEAESEAKEEQEDDAKDISQPPVSKAQIKPSKKARKSIESEAERESALEPEPEVEPEVEAQPEPAAVVRSDSDVEVEEQEESVHTATPKPNNGTSHQVRNFESGQETGHVRGQDAEDEEQGNKEKDSSDDEICGPKTPMRRATRSQKASRQEDTFSASTHKHKTLQTPARRLLGHRATQGTPQTQRLPQNTTQAASPPRPMTVARAANKLMVFRPLKQQTPRPTPLPIITVNVLDTLAAGEETQDETESELEESSADELDAQLESCHDDDIMIMPTPARTIRFESVESDSEDELAAAANLLGEDDEPDEDTIVEEDNNKESDYIDLPQDAADASSEESDSATEETQVDDSILPQPHFSAEFTTSLPSSPISVAASVAQIDVEDSELLSSPAPSTPASVIHRDFADVDSPSENTPPASRLSLDDNDLLSLIEDEGATTPNVNSRVSFSNTTAKMLKTPRMQFALGGLDANEIDDSPSVTVTEPVQNEDDVTMTVNPSQLEVDEHGIKLSSNLENAAAIPTPYLATPAARERLSMGLSKERMSLLKDDIFDLVNFDQASPAKEDVDTPILDLQHIEADPMELSTPGYSSRRQSYLPQNDLTRIEQTGSARRSSLAPPVSPSYARSMFAFDSRRKSLPAAGLHTPSTGDLRPRTAETSIKPTTSVSFAKLWASKQRRSSVRKSLLEHTIPDLAEMHSFVPKEQSNARKRDSMSSQSRLSTIEHVQAQSFSPHVPFSGAKPRRHTPSSSYKVRSVARSPLKTRSSSRSPVKFRGSSRSPMKLRDASRSPVKRLREAPRTPMKTPLKAAGLATPAVYPMTPHPMQPLKAVTALVEVFTLDGSSASGPFIALLQGLGARTTKTWSDRVTHVIFKDGSPATLQKVRLGNKNPNSKKVFCVNSRWVTDCERSGTRMDEQADIYTVDLNEVPRGGRRRRKSMEPAALRNVDGNIVHSNTSSANSSANRKSVSSRQSITGGRQSINLVKTNKSLARVSLASSFWGDDSPVKKTPGRKQARDSWDDDEEMADAFFDEPTAKFDVSASLGVRGASLEAGQMTAPVDRVRKLRIRDEDNRRLTFMGGRE
ncbi:hypothetical protein E4T38_09759 [Aureobasidium subglaciale]|nr:hypothetical protein E4T38_09759 [Aureobasidium subglaciale]KAI5213456.1 hypothetical protein E4T40_09721 [Aureobasidium subglaciale]KAI5214998.1 hypothetical protein E4T41_09751 [Aureobasidium subglaciale]KAI5253164.1 hypothetical protein E4T46_09726 [Aureobasidium subglaciale]